MIVHCRELKRVVNPNQGRGRLHLPLFVFLVGSFGCKCAFLWHQCITIISDCKFVSSMQFSKSFCASFLESPPLVALSGCGQGTGGYTWKIGAKNGGLWTPRALRWWWWKITRWALIICCKMKLFSRSQFNHSVIKECRSYIYFLG